ncbi:phospholipase C [Chryseobacterium bernardetii]|uniref:Phospholipase C n=2 Tax=Chryseobacterium TaxID=59732 RepID=A0A543DT86_9FLAO|nr:MULTISPECIES: phospholipase C, phosphocholine-specific [Chryseobacterium]MDR6373181.1 phospholipase C [Chryseobacterium vietnamense]MDR6443700.1 phospholipase C [Chryseobacterium bernardetii]TQM12533.1 phospholipase C [Chryseobacterium aquifrigidense]
MNRREFLEKSSLLLAGLGTSGVLHPSILKALAIDPAAQSTFYDAEHVVILMQENRSFDHAFGALKGVRGFLDKRAFVKQDGHSVFFQKNDDGKYASPARLDLRNTKSTWMSSLPHSWADQQKALNKGKFDQWLQAKASGNKDYKNIPLTLGYYNREDLPFYYQLADAFTIFDQYFSSSLTGTTPNRLFLWSGTLREQQNGKVKANVVNENIDYDKARQAKWKSFPEILEQQNVSWRIYQNEISLPKGMSGEQEAWLSNFTDNPIEWFSRFNVKFSKGYYQNIPNIIAYLKQEIEKNPKQKERLEAMLAEVQEDQVKYHPDNYSKLSKEEKNLHEKAFTTNSNDPDYWKLEIGKDENGERLVVPEGDVLFQFRKDVEEKKLPLVSWLVAPEHFSDHPGSPWYGAWYISEVLNILTQDPETWKKTIFIINYDENDGYFDHVLPFAPPVNPSQPVDMNGKEGVEYVDQSQEYMSNPSLKNYEKVEGTVGLGYRVPMIIASPWTKGGFVNSEVSDHTSVLQFLEKFIMKKFKKNVHIDNISDWRRAICGDLTSAFNSSGVKAPQMNYLNQKDYAKTINAARNKPVPDLKWYSEDELKDSLLDIQERGLKPSNPLPYHFHVNLEGGQIKMTNLKENGVPLLVYDRTQFNSNNYHFSYALYSMQSLSHAVHSGAYDYEIFGPNGFFRKFQGSISPEIEIILVNVSAKNQVELTIRSDKKKNFTISLEDLYTKNKKTISVQKSEEKIMIDLDKFKGWYDLKITSNEHLWHFAGRIETGKVSVSDPHWA